MLGCVFLCWLMGWGDPRMENPFLSSWKGDHQCLGVGNFSSEHLQAGNTPLCDVSMSFMGEADLPWITAVTCM